MHLRFEPRQQVRWRHVGRVGGALDELLTNLLTQSIHGDPVGSRFLLGHPPAGDPPHDPAAKPPFGRDRDDVGFDFGADIRRSQRRRLQGDVQRTSRHDDAAADGAQRDRTVVTGIATGETSIERQLQSNAIRRRQQIRRHHPIDAGPSNHAGTQNAIVHIPPAVGRPDRRVGDDFLRKRQPQIRLVKPRSNLVDQRGGLIGIDQQIDQLGQPIFDFGRQGALPWERCRRRDRVDRRGGLFVADRRGDRLHFFGECFQGPLRIAKPCRGNQFVDVIAKRPQHRQFQPGRQSDQPEPQIQCLPRDRGGRLFIFDRVGDRLQIQEFHPSIAVGRIGSRLKELTNHVDLRSDLGCRRIEFWQRVGLQGFGRRIDLIGQPNPIPRHGRPGHHPAHQPHHAQKQERSIKHADGREGSN